jgi:hypothetical protein
MVTNERRSLTLWGEGERTTKDRKKTDTESMVERCGERSVEELASTEQELEQKRNRRGGRRTVACLC